MGTIGDKKQAVLLTLLPRFSCLPNLLSDITGVAPHYSGGTVPAFHRSSLLSPDGHLSYPYLTVDIISLYIVGVNVTDSQNHLKVPYMPILYTLRASYLYKIPDISVFL